MSNHLGPDQDRRSIGPGLDLNCLQLSRGMRFPIIWYVRPAQAQTRLIRAFAGRLNILCSRGTKVEKMKTLAPERYTAGFCMVAKVIPWCI